MISQHKQYFSYRSRSPPDPYRDKTKLSPAAELFAFGQWNVGNPQSEFLQLYRFSVMSGLHYYWN